MAKPVIGLVGGMGSGKSAVAEEFARHGGRVINADRLGHEALRQPDVREQLVRRWGPRVLNAQSEIDRPRVAAIVFGDPAERQALEAAVHPWIGGRIREEMDAVGRDPAARFAVLDAAVMLEAGWNNVCDRLVYVHAPRAARLRRLAVQRGWDAVQVAAREQAQLPLVEKLDRADAVLNNGGSREDLARQVEDLLRQWGLST